MEAVGALVKDRSRVLSGDFEPDASSTGGIPGVIESRAEVVGNAQPGETAHRVQSLEIGDRKDAGDPFREYLEID